MRRAHAVAGVVLVTATPVATWWVVGDQSEDVDPANADYVLTPPSVSGSVELALGAGACVLVVTATVALAVASMRGRLGRRWWGFLAPLVVIGMFVGASYRVMTAAVIGANIGAGMVILVGPPLILVALAVSAHSWRALTRARGRHDSV